MGIKFEQNIYKKENGVVTVDLNPILRFIWDIIIIIVLCDYFDARFFTDYIDKI